MAVEYSGVPSPIRPVRDVGLSVPAAEGAQFITAGSGGGGLRPSPLR
jgi:hypothetical protein